MLNLKQKSRATLLVALISCVLITSVIPSTASRNGIERKNNPFSVGISFTMSGIDQVCSAALVSPTVLVTAEHCIYDESGAMGTNYYFTKPGVALDAAIDPSAKKISIVKAYVVSNYKNNAAIQLDGIAYVELNTAIASSGFIKIATAEEVAAISAGQILKGYGFGHVYETNAPYAIYAREYSVNWEQPTQNPAKTVQLNSTTSVACSGDSGGAITSLNAKGEEVLVAVMSGAAQVINHCGTAGADGKFIMQASVVSSYDSIKPAAATVKPAAKRFKITCVKDKAKKFVTGTNPKCPAGYKLTAKIAVK